VTSGELEPDGSITDRVAWVWRWVTVEEVNGVFREAADGRLGGILVHSDEPLVSSDVAGDLASYVFDFALTMAARADGQGLRLVDKCGYASRLGELAASWRVGRDSHEDLCA
jgi:glyceraldehyde 3-phosphate dehydrogenase